MSNNQLNNDLQQPNYLICTLHGFNKLVLYENKEYIVNNGFIKSISINDELKSMYVKLESNIAYTGNEEKIRNYLYHLCFNLIVKTEVSYDVPTYSISTIHENNKHISANEHLKMTDTFKATVQNSAKCIYDTIVKSPTKIEENYIKYERIFKTLHNPNLIAQFMSLYQFLMELLQGNNHPSQKLVTDYLKNNINNYDFIDFKPTRKQGRNFEEDCFTYIRNEIGHCEETNDLNLYKQLGNKINQKLIKNLIIVINDIIMTN